VVHGNRKTKVNGIGPPIKPKTQNRPTQSQAYVCCNDIRPFKIIQRKEREKHPREAPFSLPFWCIARGTEGAHFQDRRNGSPGFIIRERASFSLCPAVMVDTSRRASAVTSVGKSKVMGKIKQKVKRSRKLPWPPKLTPTKDNDHHSPALRWSLLILDMELRKNGLEVGESIY
jgi:hypothetical protein